MISFAIVGLIFSQLELLSPALYPKSEMVLYSLVITFFAFEGFRAITNTNLYAATNVTYQLAKDGELPYEFDEPIGHSREGLVISGALIILMTDFSRYRKSLRWDRLLS